MRSFFHGIKRTYAHLTRFRHILAVLIKYGFEEAAGVFARRFKVGLGSQGISPAERAKMDKISLARRTRMAMEELGPTFIKLGQLLSTRPDLVPPDFIDELEHLQDRVTPEPYGKIRDEINRQLGGWPEDIFSEFDEEPIAAASIAQVHRARTKDGREVVVKVRRPGIVKTLQIELEILQDVAGLLKARMKGPQAFDPVQAIQEFSQAVSKEVDLANERRNQQRFIKNFADDPTVHVPAVFEEYSSEGILTMEYIDGIKPSQHHKLECAGLDLKELAGRGADFVLKQVFDFGFFHTDPHPGNFLVVADNILCPLDFGQCGRLTSQDGKLLEQIVLAIVHQDVSGLISSLERADMVPEDTDPDEIARDAEALLSAYQGLPLKDIPFREALSGVFDLIRRHRVQTPRDFTLMLKSLMTIESFARDLDPDFQILDHLKPYARKFKFEKLKPSEVFSQFARMAAGARDLAGRLPDDASAIMARIRRGQFRLNIHHEHLEELEDTIDNSSNRISFALIIAALLVASSLLVPQEGMVLGFLSFQVLGVIGYLTAAVMGIWMLISIIRRRNF